MKVKTKRCGITNQMKLRVILTAKENIYAGEDIIYDISLSSILQTISELLTEISFEIE